MYILTNYLSPISNWRTDEGHCFHYFVECRLKTLDYAAQNTESFTVRNRIYRKQKQSLKSAGHAYVQRAVYRSQRVIALRRWRKVDVTRESTVSTQDRSPTKNKRFFFQLAVQSASSTLKWKQPWVQQHSRQYGTFSLRGLDSENIRVFGSPVKRRIDEA